MASLLKHPLTETSIGKIEEQMAKPTPQDPLNDVAMRGKGVYNAHSELQYEAMLKVLPLLAKAAKETERTRQPSDKPVTIAEYGAAQGNNSILPLETITQSLPSSQLQIVLNDRAGNDFNTLSATITEWTSGIPRPLFVSMAPGSFYTQVVHAGSVDLGFCLTSLQHLERTPRTVDENNLRPLPNAAELISAQSHGDFRTFLRHRETETVPGSSLVLCFPVVSSSGRENLAGPTASLFTATMEMIMEGRLAKEVVANFQRPTHDRTMDEVRRSLDAAGKTWAVRDCFEDSVLHPAIEELRKDIEANGPSEAASVKYADAVIEWLVAVVGGFFLKGVKLVDPACSDEQAGAVLAEWTARIKAVFLRDHRDEEVFLSFVYIWLQRAQPMDDRGFVKL